MDIQKERKAFETYMAERYKNLIDMRVCINSDGDYMAWDMQVAWNTWQAAKAQAVPEGFVLVPSGVLDLTRFMCETWTEIDKFVYKNCQNLELYPLIQGSKTQSAIRKIGQQKFNPFSVGAGIQAMIEAQEEG